MMEEWHAWMIYMDDMYDGWMACMHDMPDGWMTCMGNYCGKIHMGKGPTGSP